MGKNIFRVTNANGKVNELFETRKSAVSFIVDEFSMTLAFRDDKEVERLTEYMETHNSTPKQYPFEYVIEEVKINHDYD